MTISRFNAASLILLATCGLLTSCANEEANDHLYDEIAELTERNAALEAEIETLKDQASQRTAMMEEMGKNIRSQKSSVEVNRRLSERDAVERH